MYLSLQETLKILEKSGGAALGPAAYTPSTAVGGREIMVLPPGGCGRTEWSVLVGCSLFSPKPSKCCSPRGRSPHHSHTSCLQSTCLCPWERDPRSEQLFQRITLTPQQQPCWSHPTGRSVSSSAYMCSQGRRPHAVQTSARY